MTKHYLTGLFETDWKMFDGSAEAYVELSKYFTRNYITKVHVSKWDTWQVVLTHVAPCGHRAMCGLEDSMVHCTSWKEAYVLGRVLASLYGRVEVQVAPGTYVTGKTVEEAAASAAKWQAR